ncbi:MAG: phosphatidylserine/phosphatidylglycerophosphate/cardiolipin synthase family protein [Planctomycetota bacterium]
MRTLLLFALLLGPLLAGTPGPGSPFTLDVREDGAPPLAAHAWLRPGGRGLILEQTWPSRVELELVADAQGFLYGEARLAAGVRERLLDELAGARLQVWLRESEGTYAGRWRIVSDARNLRQGHLRLRPSAERPPSPLAATIRGAVEPVLDRSTVPVTSAFSRGRPELEPLVRGRAIFGRMADLIANAQHEVLFLTYTWEADCAPAQRIVDGLRALAERRRQTGGPPVRAYFVVNGGWFAKRTAIKAMRQDLEGLGLAPFVDVRLVRHKHRLFGALHTKSLVVDGRVAGVTGANPEAKHDGETPWYDLGFVVHGQAAWGAREDFAQVWRKTTGEELPAIPVPPAHPDDVPVYLIGRKANESPLRRRIDDPQGQAYLAAIENARRSLRILTPNLNYRPLMEALVRAAARGVHVQLVLSLGFNKDAENRPLQGGCNETTARWLQSTLFEQQIGGFELRWYSVDGREPHVGNGPSSSHAKYLTVDGQIALVGSTNLDTQSLLHSRELDFLVDDPATVHAWDARAFLPVWERAVPAWRFAR